MFDWLHEAFFDPTSPGEKIFVMLLAIALFVLVVGAILYLVDRPKVPNWLLVTGFLGPVALFLGWGLVRPAIITIAQSFRTYDAQGRDVGGPGWTTTPTISTAPATFRC